eukprot:TRINITY_DN2249_c0_g1_i3.p1 TRINITY_DN2249_c0_g1~~TRINITY_DN2249_c0_g1_i3.p1  ORF type:complete len:160 (-),score=42.39 TRINITY_DN2249_c0_g1_i3:49-528(-)
MTSTLKRKYIHDLKSVPTIFYDEEPDGQNFLNYTDDTAFIITKESLLKVARPAKKLKKEDVLKEVDDACGDVINSKIKKLEELSQAQGERISFLENENRSFKLLIEQKTKIDQQKTEIDQQKTEIDKHKTEIDQQKKEIEEIKKALKTAVDTLTLFIKT